MSLDLELGYATRLADDYQHLITPSVDDEGLLEATYRAGKLVGKIFPFYDPEMTSPIPGFEGETGSVNCAGRTAVFHSVLTENPRLYPVIAKVDIGEYDDVHYLNGVEDTDTGDTFIVDSTFRSVSGIDFGVIEVLADPWATQESNPSFYGPIFEAVMSGTTALSQNPELPKISFILKYLEMPHMKDEKGRGTRLHVHPENIPTLELIDQHEIKILADTVVTVFDSDKSDRIVDQIAYGNKD